MTGRLHGRIVADEKIVRIAKKTEKTEPLSQLHAGTGPGLFRGGTLAHLFLVADNSPGILPADAEINRNIEPAVVDAPNLLEHVQPGGLQPLIKPGHGRLRATGLVLVIGVLLSARTQGDQLLFHGIINTK